MKAILCDRCGKTVIFDYKTIHVQGKVFEHVCNDCYQDLIKWFDNKPEKPKRICAHCGKELGDEGYTDESGFYCHYECFDDYMNKTYGEHGWMAVDGDGLNGYYVAYTQIEGDTYGIVGTGIYYTWWGDE